jgi:hypothetical protein
MSTRMLRKKIKMLNFSCQADEIDNIRVARALIEALPQA